MWKIVATLASMVVSGIGTYAVLALTAMVLGGQLHGNYMYYDSVVLGPWGLTATAIGFFAPGIVVWYLDKRGYKNAWKIFLGALALMMVNGFGTHMVMEEILFTLGKYFGAAVVCGLLALSPIGFLAPGVVVWYLHKRGTRKEQSR